MLFLILARKYWNGRFDEHDSHWLTKIKKLYNYILSDWFDSLKLVKLEIDSKIYMTNLTFAIPSLAFLCAVFTIEAPSESWSAVNRQRKTFNGTSIGFFEKF